MSTTRSLNSSPTGNSTQSPCFERSRALQTRLHRVIPGGCHTYAKGDDQYPVLAPGLIERGAGCRVWDVDGNAFIEYGMGGRSVTLGHAFEPVLDAVREVMERGANFTRPALIELQAAEALLGILPAADMVKFTKDGSTATTAALKLARACTGREKVALCSDHPFFSYDDWFMTTTPVDAGIPASTPSLSLSFAYNQIDSLERLFAEHPGEIAAVILEPAKYDDPEDRFLHRVQECCRREGAVFILDEMITGFRWHLGGAQAYYGLDPDLSTFGKGLGNGFAVSALAGKRHLMERGGLDHAQPRVFLLSTTHGAESHGLAAAQAVIAFYQEHDVIGHLERTGERLRALLEEVIASHGLEEHLSILGKPVNMVYAALDAEGQRCQSFRSLLLQETIRRGVLAPSLVVSYSHTERELQETAAAFDGACEVYRRALRDGVEKYLTGRPSQVVYRRFNA